MQTAALTPTFSATLRDLAELAKPRITLMVAITAAGGMRLAPGVVEPWRAAVMLLTTCMVVAGANALNCYLERDSDGEKSRLDPGAAKGTDDGRNQQPPNQRPGLSQGAMRQGKKNHRRSAERRQQITEPRPSWHNGKHGLHQQHAEKPGQSTAPAFAPGKRCGIGDQVTQRKLVQGFFHDFCFPLENTTGPGQRLN